MKRQLTEWEEMFANHISKKGLTQNVQRTPKTQQQKRQHNFLNRQRSLITIYPKEIKEWLINT